MTTIPGRRPLRKSAHSEHVTVGALLQERAGDVGGQRAFFGGTTNDAVTWRQIADLSEHWAATFDAKRTIGIALASPTTFCAAFLAALAAGCTVAPLDPRATGSETSRILERLKVSDVVVDVDNPSPALVGSGFRLFGASLTQISLLEEATRKDPETHPVDAAVLLATSGTTGTPKAVPLGAEQLMYVAQEIVEHHRFGPTDRGYCPLPLFHVNAQVVGVLSTLVAGGSLVVDDRFHRSSFWEVVDDHEVTWLNLVPAILALLADTTPPASATDRIRFARSASAPLPDSVRDRFERASGIGVLETYGMTEAGSQICANPLDRRRRRPGSVGMPVGVELRIVDAARVRVPEGEVGSIEITGLGIVDHYLDENLEPFAARLEDGWLSTGDLGYLDSDGFVSLVGRADEVINRGGEKLYPREIEEILRQHPLVTDAAVAPRSHPVLGFEPIAFVTTSGGKEATELVSELAERCRASLSRYKQPVEIRVVDDLPKGPTGKVSRKRLADGLRADTPIELPDGSSRGFRANGTGFGDGGTMVETGLDLPERTNKPRREGLTVVIDGGLPLRLFEDTIESTAKTIDLVKFGWGTALATPKIVEKIACLERNGIGWFFGGTLFEKYIAQDRLGAFIELCHRFGASYVEVSNGTIHLPTATKARCIAELSKEFVVLAEVGYKDNARSDALDADLWLSYIRDDFAAGATYVITEARESGRSGICDENGDLRFEVIEEIIDADDIDNGRLVFEAPTKDLQTFFVTRIGPNVNLANIAPIDVIGVETLRLGLRSDTLLHFELERQHLQEMPSDA